ncbi:MBL fold metallo-hydrolase [Halovulum dunhuangense]|uniref:MBL fold metallo-hydrolase n=1 Tax=Halovulum dunhuangense TaxID=1505036 RepID=A0A849KRI3_9RHOB|nr:MBL fold metallo-hydrolase [Halovulum dunhuangense]NNU79459.1 MBL fold metallo-hydrolase [Halovulum dunhuangense]
MLTRRSFGLSALAAGASGIALPALGLAPQAGVQVPGIYRRRIGDFEITAINDGYTALTADLFSGVPAGQIEAALAAEGQGTTMPTAVNTFVVNTPTATWLVDAGAGVSAAFGPNLGRTVELLAAAGISPEQIDGVILTHAHIDHVEGLVDASGNAVFANAEIVLREVERAFWFDDGMLSQAPEAARGLFESARRSLTPYADRTRLVTGGEVAPGLELIHAPGHTPGHSVLHVSSGDDQLMILADSFHNAAIHTAYPDAGFGFDTDAALAAQSRRAQFDRVAADGLLVAATHVSFPGFGRIVAEGDRYRYLPAEWSFPL